MVGWMGTEVSCCNPNPPKHSVSIPSRFAASPLPGSEVRGTFWYERVRALGVKLGKRVPWVRMRRIKGELNMKIEKYQVK